MPPWLVRDPSLETVLKLTKINRMSQITPIDTLPMARTKFPGAQVNLNALCRKYNINNTHRNLHGALVDADLLASVYLELVGGKQPALTLIAEQMANYNVKPLMKHNRPRRIAKTDSTELEAHKNLVKTIPNAIWNLL